MVKVKKTDRLIFDLKLHQVDRNEEKKEALRREISDKYGVPIDNVEVNFVSITVDENGNKVSLASDIVNNIQNPAFQQSLFPQYLSLKGITDVNMDSIIAIDNQVNDYVDFDSYSKYKSYKFKYAKWDNYLSYGKGNYFDFSKLNGLVLLNGYPENQCGKTTFAIDLLRFALFGKAQKVPKLEKIFNVYMPKETEAMVEVCIEIDGMDYVIRRTVTRPPLNKRTAKSKCKQKVEYFKLINGAYETIGCEGENTAETNNIIRDSVGGVDDYNLIISATAKSLGDIFDMGQTDKGELFSRWLGLQTLERKSDVAKELWKKNISPSLLSNKYDRGTLEGENADFDAIIGEDGRKIEETQTSMASHDTRIVELNAQKVEVLSGKREIKDGLDKLDFETIDARCASENDELGRKRAQMRGYKDEYAGVKDAAFDVDAYEELKKLISDINESIHGLNVQNAEIKAEIGALRKDNERIQGLIDGKRCPTCGQTINTDEQNGHISENNAHIKELIERGVENKKQIEALTSRMAEKTTEQSKMENERDRLSKKNELELKMTAVKANIDALKLKINELARQRSEIETNEDNIRHNNAINIRVANIDEEIKVEQKLKEDCIRTIEGYKSEIKRYGDEIDKRKKIIEKLAEEEVIIRNWSIYQELVGKNGIVKIVLKMALPILNNEIERLLNGLCDFKVVVSVSDDNSVCLDMERQGQKLDIGTSASGFEATMASLAVRHALSCIATLSRPNFTVYDEILGGVAVSNYENVRELFNRMAKSYDFILHITHNEMISDWHNETITVTKDKDGVSVIETK